MPKRYEALTALIALTGTSGILLTGQANPVMLLPAPALLIGYARLLNGSPPASKRFVGGLSLATAALFVFDVYFITGDFFLSVAHLTILFQAIKSFDLREPWDHLQVCFMGLLQIIVASELTSSIVFAGVFVVFLSLIVSAMVLYHFLKEGASGPVGTARPILTITVFVLFMTAFFFVFTPRLGGGFIGKRSAKGIEAVGFRDVVEFGTFGEIKLDHTVVMRVEISGKKHPLYWRGTTLDYFDGVSWQNTLKGKYGVERLGDAFIVLSGVGAETEQRFLVEPMDTDVVFGLGRIASVRAAGRAMLKDGAGSLYYPLKQNRRTEYTVFSVEGAEGGDGPDLERYLRYPPKLTRLAALARKVTEAADTDMKKALMIEDHLKRNYGYSLSVKKPPKGVTPIEYFLFGSKEGYCEHYATSMVLMLRAVGIPAKIVAGFQGGLADEGGDYVMIRNSDAHTWVEAWTGEKWALFDPTPPVSGEGYSALSLFLDSVRMKWYRYVVGFGRHDQREIVRYASMPFSGAPDFPGLRTGIRPIAYAALFAVFLFILNFLKGFRLRKRHGFETGVYLRARRRIKKLGGKVSEFSSPSEVAAEAERLGVGPAAAEIVAVYECARFGKRPAEGQTRKRLKKALKDLKGRR